ncbi:MAG: M28 family peptidase [Balneola sp.]|nr:M28 family peptidase [Balneola sp.]MBO6650592.1 M28 family peptidase [Balneola sp.]MBO6712629.1 M28 family peptidase [Balneola sp.]MBO6800877.1 M28 family peptidase [Balneola sp.]MBO6870550.1 M28 family peptidase [Balneola sp.]
MKKLFVLILLAATGISCTNSKVDNAAQLITKDGMMNHIETLSSDEFLGRSTGTEGEEKSVNYLVEQFKAIGVTSGVEDGSYVQHFPLLGQKTMSHSMEVRRPSRRSTINTFTFFEDFVAWPSNQSESVDIKDAELVYVGYGIQAPEENWDDFKGVDVKGKVIIIKNNDPEYDEDLFGGKTRLYYGRYTYKYEKAKEMGALGAIIIHTTQTAGYGWGVVSNGWSRERFYVKSDENADKGNTEMNGWVTYEAGKTLFNQAGLDIDEMLKAADSPDFEPVELKNTGLSVSIEAEYRDINSRNVIAKIEGNDSELKDEYLVLTAHYDHLGITKPIDGDSVNNGAEDNAAGVSAVLESMKAYKSIQSKLKRSVLAVVVGAEEVGLLGSQYWAENPTVHPGKVTGNINLDGMNVYGETNDLVIIGYGRNTLADKVVEVAEEQGRTVKPDANPEQGIFYRSDHFNMAKVGIPAIFPNPGNEFINKPEGYAETVDSVSAANYHSVNDEINEYWDIAGAVKDTRLFFEVGFRALNDDKLQSWKQGDEFEATRLKMLEELK